MFTKDLGYVIGELESGADFIRRQKGIAAQGLQSAETERGQASVEWKLRNCLNAELTGNVGQFVSQMGTREWCEDSSDPHGPR